MKLLVSQKNVLADLIECSAISIEYFDLAESEQYGTTIYIKENDELRFNFRGSIQDAEYCDIYYRPTNKQPCKHIYLPMNSFEEAIPYFQEWLDCLSLEVGVEDNWKQTE